MKDSFGVVLIKWRVSLATEMRGSQRQHLLQILKEAIVRLLMSVTDF